MTGSRSRGALADLGKIVQDSKATQLTSDNKVKFKIIFNHQLENMYNFTSLQEVVDPTLKRQLNPEERLRLYELLGDCIDIFVGRTITNVEAHFRRDDENDSAFDPVGGTDMPIQHFGIHPNEKARIHGYFNSDGYFVITRLDWCHLFHLRRERQQRRNG